MLAENERKRREAVWELFQSETVFLVDHLMVLKHVCIFKSSESPWKHGFFGIKHVLLMQHN
jgi:hypothetical protein